MALGIGWKTYSGIGLALASFVVGEFGVGAPEISSWGEVMGMGLAAFGIRHKLG